MKAAAERYGYILAGSNNSRNGSWKLETTSAQAMSEDTHARLAIDNQRVYFAGFSGGARVASLLAQRCKCAAGVLLNGAGFAGVAPSRDAMFAVFAAVGTYDFNYPELSELDKQLGQAGFPHVLRHFEGPHQWAPAEVMDQALAWFRLMAMKEKREARDDGFIAAQEANAVARAQALERAGQPYEAWRAYQQAATTFDGLAATDSLKREAARLAQQKEVRDGEKREAQDLREQNDLTSPIFAGLQELRSNPANRSDIFGQTEQRVLALRERTLAEKHENMLRILRRALAGVYVSAGEAGDENLADKQFTLAENYYRLAADANPDSAWALRGLAQAQALNNERKEAIATLRRAKEKAKDPAAFMEWLRQEPAFAKLQNDPQFLALSQK
jgi:tetratricopeptide (TPR) repeat protein